jgi:hypothetical protein
MNKTIKNIFAITALTLTFAPALRCEDAQEQTPRTSKLQSVVEYIKNIRTPLTPQEKLAQHIARADVVGFKDAYNSFQKWPADERAPTLQALAITAQEVKQALQTELETMGNAQVNKTILAKGIGQTVGGLLLATTAAIHPVAIYKHGFNLRKYNGIEILSALPYIVIPGLLAKYCGMCANGKCIENHQPYLSKKTNAKILASLDIISIPIGAILGAYTTKTGIQKCKNGWNYRAYVQQKIANIDEISAFIQEQQK